MSQYFHTDDPRMIAWLADVFGTAALLNRKVRINVEDGNLSIKVGEGVWTAPFASTPDPYRDNS